MTSTLSDRAVLRFGLSAFAWTVGLFGLLRLSAVQQHLLLPLTQLQGRIAAGPSARLSVSVTLECSGADVIALCLAATLAYPVAWRRRLLGAAGGLAMILVLNTARIGTLNHAIGTPWFAPLHVYIWPAILVLATLVWVGIWMWRSDAALPRERMPGARRFAVLAVAFVAAFLAISPALLANSFLREASVRIAHFAAACLSAVGLSARAQASVLFTPNGAFAVTPECITTPLMPVYLAAVLGLPLTWRRRVFGLAAFVPLFAGLTLARLFTLALPPFLVRSPLFLIHAFYQLVLGMLLVVGAAWLRSGRRWERRTFGRAALALTASVAASVFASAGYFRLLQGEATLLRALAPHTPVTLVAPGDSQGALLVLPVYQLALFAALWLAAIGWRRAGVFAGGLAILHLGHLLLLVALGEAARLGLSAPATAVRAWAVLAPLALAWLLREREASGIRPAALPVGAPASA